jgi:hypothetical protein
LTSVTHAAEAAAVTADAQVDAMVAVVVTKETVAVDAQAVAMVAAEATASLATSQSAASTAPAKHMHFKASPLTFGLAAMPFKGSSTKCSAKKSQPKTLESVAPFMRKTHSLASVFW